MSSNGIPVRWTRIFSPRATEVRDGAGERFRAHENEPGGREHLLRRGAVAGLVEVHQHVGAVEGNDHRLRPAEHQWEQVDRDVAEINMQQLCVIFREDPLNPTRLAARHRPRCTSHAPIPEPPQEMQRRPRNQTDRRERKSLRLLAFPSDHHRPEAFQRSELPVDVQHLRLQERRAITGDDWRRLVRHGLTINHQRVTATALKRPLEELHALRLARIIRVESDVLLRVAVAGGRARIQHLQRIPVAHRGRDDATPRGRRERRRALGFDGIVTCGLAVTFVLVLVPAAVPEPAHAPMPADPAKTSALTSNIFFMVPPVDGWSARGLPASSPRPTIIHSMDYR